MSNGGNLGSDFGSHSLDPRERADADLYLDDPEAGDDEPWTPPDRLPRGAESADIENETLDQRLEQEEPEEGTAYGNPRARYSDQQLEGGDDPDAIPAEDDFLGDPDEVSQAYDRTGNHPADPNEPAEESAMHIIEDDEDIDYED